MGGAEVKEVIVRKKNKSAYFLLPLVADKSMYHISFINAYLEFPNIIILESKSDENIWNNNKYLIDKKVNDKNNIIYKFRIPEQFQEDYDRFLLGKYSKFSKEAKKIICSVNKIKGNIEDSDVYKILFRTPDRREHLEELIGVTLDHDAELLSIPNLEEELYAE